MSILADFIAFVGLLMLGYGLWLVDPAISFSVVGGLLIIFGIFLGLAQQRKTQAPNK